MPGFHHVEMWVADLDAAAAEWGWLLERLGPAGHDRRRAGVNHLAFLGGPHAGGPDHYAGWLENTAGFKAEIVAED